MKLNIIIMLVLYAGTFFGNSIVENEKVSTINLEQFYGRELREMLGNDSIKGYVHRYWIDEPSMILSHLCLEYSKGVYILIYFEHLDSELKTNIKLNWKLNDFMHQRIGYATVSSSIYKKRILNPPIYSYSQIDFTIHPRIIERNGDYFLQYQLKKNDRPFNVNKKELLFVILDNKAYYYFGHETDELENGAMIERKISNDNLFEYAKAKRIFWLNPNNSAVILDYKFI